MIITSNKMKYVIKDGENKFVPGNGAFLLTSEGWVYLSYSGKSTGFSYFTNRQQAEKEKENLQNLCSQYGFNKEFKLEYINIKNIPIGKLIIEGLFLPSKKLVNV